VARRYRCSNAQVCRMRSSLRAQIGHNAARDHRCGSDYRRAFPQARVAPRIAAMAAQDTGLAACEQYAQTRGSLKIRTRPVFVEHPSTLRDERAEILRVDLRVRGPAPNTPSSATRHHGKTPSRHARHNVRHAKDARQLGALTRASLQRAAKRGAISLTAPGRYYLRRSFNPAPFFSSPSSPPASDESRDDWKTRRDTWRTSRTPGGSHGFEPRSGRCQRRASASRRCQIPKPIRTTAG